MPEALTDFDDMRRYSNALRQVSERRIGELSGRLQSGDLNLADWQEQMKAELRRANLEQFVTANGGVRENIDRREYLKLGTELRRQYRYLARFAAVIEAAAADDKPLGFVTVRAALYARSTQASFWRASVPVPLTQVPRDGKTRCKTSCKCRLKIDRVRDAQGVVTEIQVWWRLGIAEHCDDCVGLARSWNPLRVPVDETFSEAASVEQAIELLISEQPELETARRLLREAWDIREVTYA